MSNTMWTQEQDDLLRKFYPSMGCAIPELSQFSTRQIHARSRIIGVNRVYWTDEEVALLKEYYPQCGTDIPQLSNKSAKAISCLAYKLGLTVDRVWSAEEDELLRSKYASCGLSLINITEHTRHY